MPATNHDKRRAFAQSYAISGNASAAAREAGVPTSSAHSMGYKWLRTPDVLQMIREEQVQVLRGLSGAALRVLSEVLNDAGAPAQTRLSAAREVLDRAGFAKPKRREYEQSLTTDTDNFKGWGKERLEAYLQGLGIDPYGEEHEAE